MTLAEIEAELDRLRSANAVCRRTIEANEREIAVLVRRQREAMRQKGGVR